jgi:Tol biopolymer transport system component
VLVGTDRTGVIDLGNDDDGIEVIGLVAAEGPEFSLAGMQDRAAATDSDDDGISNLTDDCPEVFDPLQPDVNGDGIGDVCQPPDVDLDGIADDADNCAVFPNPGQNDSDSDGDGDLCDLNWDPDGDGVRNALDNCPDVPNPGQHDADGDGVGNLCDPDFLDTDGDGTVDGADNCPNVWNADQRDDDQDGLGDRCDDDGDNDGALDDTDNCPLNRNEDQLDSDSDTIGDVCDGLVFAGATVGTSLWKGPHDVNPYSGDPSISNSGRFVSYTVSNDLAVSWDDAVYVFDRDVSGDGVLDEPDDVAEEMATWVPDRTRTGNGDSVDSTLSGDGRYVAYTSAASDLVAGDTNGDNDIFLYDTTTDTTRRVSLAADGGQAVGGPSIQPSISGDGEHLAFLSYAQNIVADVPPPPTGQVAPPRIYVRNLTTGATEFVAEGWEPSLSADGERLTYTAFSGGVAVISVRGASVLFEAPGNRPSLSGDGHRVAWQGEEGRIQVQDLDTDVTTLASVALNGDPVAPYSPPALSADGGAVRSPPGTTP